MESVKEEYDYKDLTVSKLLKLIRQKKVGVFFTDIPKDQQEQRIQEAAEKSVAKLLAQARTSDWGQKSGELSMDEEKPAPNHIFKTHTLYQVLDAIEKEKTIDSIDISEAIKETGFRFAVESDFEISYKFSKTLGAVINRNNTIPPDVSAKGRQKAQTNANQFATNMYETVSVLKNEKKLTTYRAMVDALNEKAVPTRTGRGVWHLKSLQNLEDRWENLGLKSPFEKPTQP